jgi:general L-amino acid transport system substrate-binding protein
MGRLFGLVLTLACVASGATHAQNSGSATLDAVRGRGQLLCGTSGDIPGFAFVDSKGLMQGLDADGCRAIAAATLGDAGKVRFVPLTAQNRFTALQAGEVDVLLRNTGWSLTREASLGLLFAAVNFWDGTSLLVKTASNVKHVTALGGATICVRPGTSTELDLADWARRAKISYTPVQIGGVNEIQQAFLSGRCDAFTTDSSQLAGFRFMQGPKAEELTILPEPIGTGPSGSMVRKGDDKWYDIVRWVHYAQVAAENLEVGQGNVDGFAATANPDIRRLLGLEGDLGKALGLDNRWAYNVVKQVGNYGDMYDRSITPEGLARGPNALWTKGGLQFAPPLR